MMATGRGIPLGDRSMRVRKNLPRVVTQLRPDRELNPGSLMLCHYATYLVKNNDKQVRNRSAVSETYHKSCTMRSFTWWSGGWIILIVKIRDHSRQVIKLSLNIHRLHSTNYVVEPAFDRLSIFSIDVASISQFYRSKLGQPSIIGTLWHWITDLWNILFLRKRNKN